ncbi:MAG TPA: tetratricopeptide repeat protein [Candidatus Brocadiaceae bacterium]
MSIKHKNATYLPATHSPVAKLNPKLLYILLSLIPLCVFLNTLQSGFVYDDIGVIEDNYFIRSLQNVPKIFSRNYFHLANELSYRPVVTLTYFLDYAIWRLNPSGYHLTNVILHTITGVLLYAVLSRLIRKRPVALLSAILFSMHPCVTEAVNAISYREDILATLFIFLSCLCLILSRKKVYYALSLLSYLLSLFSKETAIVMPLFILLYWTFFMRKHYPSFRPVREGTVSFPSASHVNGSESFSPAKSRWVRDFINYYLGYILISLFYVCIRFIFLKNPLEVSVGYIQGSIAINFMTMVKILASYVKLMFLPFHLSADYTIDPVLSIFDASFITSLTLLVAVGLIIFKIINTTVSLHVLNRDRIYGMFMLCFFAALLPVLNIVPIGHIMADRYLYLPVAGFCIVISGLSFHGVITQPPLSKREKFPVYNHNILSKIAFVIPLISILCIFFTTKTILRNRDWRNEYTFWTKILSEQPQNYDAHNNLGNYFYKQGVLDRAIYELEEAVRLKKNYPEGHNSLGTMYIDKGLIDKAIAEYVAAVKYRPIFPQAYYNLGNAYIKKGLVDDSIAFFNKAISQGMYNPQVFNNLGSAYMKKGMMDEAVAQYQRALSVYKDFAEVHSNLGYVYTEKGDLDRAMFELREALRLQPNHANAHNNLGAVYCQQGLWDMALDEFMKAVRFDPKNASAHKNIGMICFTKGDKQRAKEHLLQMLKCDPNYLKDAGIYAIVSQLGLIKE